eukprot:2819013-Rhodomonas_salina.1
MNHKSIWHRQAKLSLALFFADWAKFVRQGMVDEMLGELKATTLTASQRVEDLHSRIEAVTKSADLASAWASWRQGLD